MTSKRLVFDSVLAGACAVVLALIGAWGARVALPSLAESVGATKLVLTSPTDMLWFQVKHGLVLGGAPLLSWIAMLVHRVRSSGPPDGRWSAGYGALPITAMLCGMFCRSLLLRGALSDLTVMGNGSSALAPMITVDSLSLASWGATAGIIAATLLMAARIAVGTVR